MTSSHEDSVTADLDGVPRRTWAELRKGLHVHLAEPAASTQTLPVTAEGLRVLACLGTPVAFMDPATRCICWGNDRFSRLCGRTGLVTDWKETRPDEGPLTQIIDYVRDGALSVDVYAPLRVVLPGLLGTDLACESDDMCRLHCQAVRVVADEPEGIGSPSLPLNRDLLSLQFPTFHVPRHEPGEAPVEPFVQTGTGQVVALIDSVMAYRSDIREDLTDLRRRVLENRLDEPVGARDVLIESGLAGWKDSASLAVMLGLDFSRRPSMDMPAPLPRHPSRPSVDQRPLERRAQSDNLQMLDRRSQSDNLGAVSAVSLRPPHHRRPADWG